MALDPGLARLASIGSDPVAAGPVTGCPNTRLGTELAELLALKNGFLALESSLFVRGSGPAVEDLASWNADQGWRANYKGMADGIFFFSEDIFGAQFGLRDETVVSFDPETGEQLVIASSLEDWAEQILSDFEFMTAYPLAKDWQLQFGALKFGQRLLPKLPFVLGGMFEVQNLYALEARIGMEVRAELAVQIRDHPDGHRVQYRVIS